MGEGEALGFVETYGALAAIEVADAMVKAAWVRVACVNNADGGLISVACTGDLASCAAAVDAGKAAATRLGLCLRVNLIPRPGEGVAPFLAANAVLAGPGRAAGPASKTRKRKGKGRT